MIEFHPSLFKLCYIACLKVRIKTFRKNYCVFLKGIKEGSTPKIQLHAVRVMTLSVVYYFHPSEVSTLPLVFAAER